jgi:hypothetical protein
MTNYKNGNGFVDNATAKRIADMKALGVSKEAMTSATRGTQAAERNNGVAGSMAGEMQGDRTFGWGNVYGDIKLQLNSTQPVFGPTGIDMAAGIDTSRFWTEYAPKAILEVIHFPKPYDIPAGIGAAILEDWIWPDEISIYQDLQTISK